MSFQWLQYLDLAKALSQHDDGDQLGHAKRRAAISRAYYAVFCAARDFLRDEHDFKLSRTGEDHVKVPAKLRELGHKKLADRLDNLREKRRTADYETGLNVDGKNVNLQLIEAEAAATDLRKLGA